MRNLLMLLIVVATACRGDSGMETRTYELARLEFDEAIALITPYVREGGHVSGKNRLITVREKPDRLTLIEDMLRKYDGAGEALDVMLDIQVIEANGFTQTDSAIADIEQTLRQTFKYRGYKLLGETHVQVREGGRFRHGHRAFQIGGALERVRSTGNEQRVPLHFNLQVIGGQAGLESTVTATIGKPFVIGQSTENGAIILVIRPSLAGT